MLENFNGNEPERIYFVPGDHVTLKHPLENRPKMMLVKEKVERCYKDKEGNSVSTFLGIKCIWFDKNSVLREAIFSTKDLIHV